MTRARIAQLKKELIHLERVRETQRQGRLPDLPRVALVGYTNAGKTSLLKVLTGEGEPADMLFATLDTTTRRAWLGQDDETGMPRQALISDTVGFIRKLPHQLVAAFRSTLGEVRTAEALLVVADAASPELEDHLKVVGDTLREIGCGTAPAPAGAQPGGPPHPPPAPRPEAPAPGCRPDLRPHQERRRGDPGVAAGTDPRPASAPGAGGLGDRLRLTPASRPGVPLADRTARPPVPAPAASASPAAAPRCCGPG